MNLKVLKLTGWLGFALLVASCASSSKPKEFLSLHPDNPHYFLFRGEPTLLIGSTEHYGAVMNLDFDYIKYFDELAACGLNITRTFSGIYVEPKGAFGIRANTLAPDSGRFICPWARSSEPGYAVGGNKFDLDTWDSGYFERLRDFVSEAGRRGIVVELDLFSNFYDTLQWKLSPLYYSNNINGVIKVKDQKEVLSLKHPELLEIQDKMVRKIVEELSGFDNLYYEICNEPYFGDTTALRQWEEHMTRVVVEAEKDKDPKHLISNNVANLKKKVASPREGVTVYNFHYAAPPVTVAMNYHLNMPIGDNETGFDGTEDEVYRKEAWNFILAGGALFNHLDYSFTAETEDGSFEIQKGQPGGGGKALRNQFRILAEFMKQADFVNMKPLPEGIVRVIGQETISVRGLADDRRTMVFYFDGNETPGTSALVEINLPAGSYRTTWVNTITGGETENAIAGHQGGWVMLNTPLFTSDIALRIKKTN